MKSPNKSNKKAPKRKLKSFKPNKNKKSKIKVPKRY